MMITGDCVRDEPQTQSHIVEAVRNPNCSSSILWKYSVKDQTKGLILDKIILNPQTFVGSLPHELQGRQGLRNLNIGRQSIAEVALQRLRRSLHTVLTSILWTQVQLYALRRTVQTRATHNKVCEKLGRAGNELAMKMRLWCSVYSQSR